MWHERSASGPVLAGDVTEEGTVAGFGYVRSGKPKATCDRLLLTGETALSEPPERPVPEDAGSVRVLAAPPLERVDPDRVHRADALDENLPLAVDEMLALPGAPWAEVAGPLIAEIRDAHHRLWLTGGFARDVIAGSADEVNDLDLTGTVPPGRFTELARRMRRRNGLEFRTRVSPHSLVCSAAPPRGEERLYEYRTLKTDAFGFPACGSDLGNDADCRDFTVNSLYYDPIGHTVADPTGRGLADLAARPRRLTSLHARENPLDQAGIVLRAVKFALRWERTIGCEVSGTAARLAHLPVTAWDGLAPTSWERLARDHRKALGGCDPGRQMSVASTLGPAAATLFTLLLEVRP